MAANLDDLKLKRLLKRGELIEAGFELYRAVAVASGATPDELDKLREAFFAGAGHAFHAPPNRRDQVGAELERFRLRKIAEQ